MEGDLTEFRNVFADGIRYRLGRMQEPGLADKQAEAILKEASEIAIAFRPRNEKLSLQGISEIVNSCIRRFPHSPRSTAAFIPNFAEINEVASAEIPF